jgi:uncharacterized membrane protein YqjE
MDTSVDPPLAQDPATRESAAVHRGPISHFFTSVTGLFGDLLSAAQTRLELVTTEIQEEIHRTAEVLLWSVIGIASAGMGLLLAALAVIFAFWDTHRLLASVLVTLVFFVIAIIAASVVASKMRGKPRLLSSTLGELARDSERLRTLHE